jgi:excisionase family DNA binding protein
MSLGEACHLLEVSESTLRQWADGGLIRVYRTPGGHRRFSTEAVSALIGKGSEPARSAKETRWTDKALQRVRRRLRSGNTPTERWYQIMDESSKSRMRLLGRRLLSIAAEHSSQHRLRADLVEEAQLIGEEYGSEMSRRGIPLRDALEAFVFFRSFLLEAVLGGIGGASDEPAKLWRSVNLLTDQMLLSMASYYDTSPLPVPGATLAAPLATTSPGKN